MKQLAEKSTDIRAIERPKAFISCAADFDKNHDHFDGGFLLWADTENMFTAASLLPNSPLSTGVRLATSFSVMKKVPDDWRSEYSDPILDECEELAWHIVRKIQFDANPAKAPCPKILFHVDTTSVSIERDGPYYNDHMGVTVKIIIHLNNVAPKYDPERWAAL